MRLARLTADMSNGIIQQTPRRTGNGRRLRVRDDRHRHARLYYRRQVPLILLTNDDGIDAVGLPSLADALTRLGRVEVVVPDRERSWVGKALTRFDAVEVRRVDVGGRLMHTTTGYPADCVQLGVHMLFDRQPDVVVSGINVGYNHGTAYLQSSGTVGAALEGALAGVPSIAFSMGTSGGDWNTWKLWAESVESISTWERVAGVATSMVEQMLTTATPGALNVGFPDSSDLATERRVTTVAEAGYDQLFSKTGTDAYMHTFGGLVETDVDLTGTDVAAAAERVISISPIGGAGYHEASRHLAAALLSS